jgi:hypothetical protein
MTTSTCLLLACLATLPLCARASAAVEWDVVRLTANDAHDVRPDTDGRHVSWTRYPTAQDPVEAIYLYDIATGSVAKIGSSRRSHPISTVRGDYVTWQSERGLEAYRISTGTTSLAAATLDNVSVLDVDGDHIYYAARESGAYEVFRYNGATRQRTRLTSAGMPNYVVTMRGSDVAYTSQFASAYGPLYHHDASTGRTTLVHSDLTNGLPVFAGEHLFWEHRDARGNPEVYAADLRTLTPRKVADGRSPQVVGGRVYWPGPDGTGTEMFEHDPATGVTTQLTEEDFAGLYLDSGGGTVTWIDTLTAAGEAGPLYFFDGRSIEVTPDGFAGQTWGHYATTDISPRDGVDTEIFLWRPAAIPEPAALPALAAAPLLLLRRRPKPLAPSVRAASQEQARMPSR